HRRHDRLIAILESLLPKRASVIGCWIMRNKKHVVGIMYYGVVNGRCRDKAITKYKACKWHLRHEGMVAGDVIPRSCSVTWDDGIRKHFLSTPGIRSKEDAIPILIGGIDWWNDSLLCRVLVRRRHGP